MTTKLEELKKAYDAADAYAEANSEYAAAVAKAYDAADYAAASAWVAYRDELKKTQEKTNDK